jgi:hypothetical protein
MKKKNKTTISTLDVMKSQRKTWAINPKERVVKNKKKYNRKKKEDKWQDYW